VLRWLLTSITFLLTAAAVFLPMLFLLASTPLHDGDVLPGPLLLSSTVLSSSVVGAAAAWFVHGLLRVKLP
jgi:hypothetical protein